MRKFCLNPKITARDCKMRLKNLCWHWWERTHPEWSDCRTSRRQVVNGHGTQAVPPPSSSPFLLVSQKQSSKNPKKYFNPENKNEQNTIFLLTKSMGSNSRLQKENEKSQIHSLATQKFVKSCIEEKGFLYFLYLFFWVFLIFTESDSEEL